MAKAEQEKLQVPAYESVEQEAQKYESVEQKLERKFLKPIGREAYNFSEIFYGSAVSYFRVPTLIRKIYNRQLLIRPIFEEKRDSITHLFGYMAGVMSSGYFLLNALTQGNESWFGDGAEYILYTALATNVLSAIYEFGRLSKSKLEHKVLNASKLNPQVAEKSKQKRRKN